MSTALRGRESVARIPDRNAKADTARSRNYRASAGRTRKTTAGDWKPEPFQKTR
jgi:hypothetical protein